MVYINRAPFYRIANIRNKDSKNYRIFTKLVLFFRHISKSFLFVNIEHYVSGAYRRRNKRVDMFSLCSNSIYAHGVRIRYISRTARKSKWIAPPLPHRAYRVAKQHIEPKAISSITSVVHIDVESSCQRHHGFDMPCHREHIHRINLAGKVAVKDESFHITCKGFGVAGDIDYLSWRE